MPRPLRAVALVAMVLLVAAPAAATLVVRLSPEDVDARADRVFVGTCRGVRVVRATGVPFPVTEYVFELEDVIQGASRLPGGPGARIVFRQAGGTAPDGSSWRIPGMPRYREGQRYRLALHGDSSVGLTSPVGLGQGVRHLGPARSPEAR